MIDPTVGDTQTSNVSYQTKYSSLFYPQKSLEVKYDAICVTLISWPTA
jgi:hypothetical protein